MLGLFRQDDSCPVDDESRKWIEDRLRWLADRLGARRCIDCDIVLPTPKFFPSLMRRRPTYGPCFGVFAATWECHSNL